MIYLIEPYNAHQKPPRKKHWMEIAEEEALHHRIMMEAEARNQILQQTIHEEAIRQHLALREQSAIKNSQNLALPQQAPQPSSQQIQDGQFAANAGAGGWVPSLFAEPFEIADFLVSPESGIGPLSIAFTNLMPTPDNDFFFWDFGSGSVTSVLTNPPDLIYTQTGSYTIEFQATSSTGNATSASKTIVISAPTLTAGFIFNSSSNGAGPDYEPMTASLTASNVYNGSGTLTNNWYFYTGSTLKSSSLGANTFTGIFSPDGTYTASLQVTESSYLIKSVKNQLFIIQT